MNKQVRGLRYIRINKHSSLSLYKQLYLCIKEAINNGELNCGDKLPTEEELKIQFQLSRPVVRQAYQELVNDGLIERKRAHGSFVKKKEHKNVNLFSLISFDEEAQLLNSIPSTKLISAGVLSGDTEIYKKMHIPLDAQIYLIKRIRFLDSKPSSYIENYVSLQRFPELFHFDFSKESLYKILDKEFYCKPLKAERNFSAGIIPDHAAQCLNVPRHSPTFVIESLVYDQYDQILEFSREYFCGENNSFNLTVYKDN